MKRQAHPLLTGTLILTATGLLTRLIGFFYRIYLSNLIGAEGMGVYQLISPISGICFALCCGPIQTAISRFVAAATATNHLEEARGNLYAGLFLSELIAFLSAIVLYANADWMAVHLVSEPRCGVLFRLLALSLPISAAHASINGYYYGLKHTEVPSLSQLAEQLVRVVAVYFIANYLMASGKQLTVTIAALGLLIGEFASLVVSFVAIRITFYRERQNVDTLTHVSLRRPFRNIFVLASPLAANRLILGVLQSIEAIQIPIRLQMSGLTSSEALSIYGILTGMSLPFILFPSALTNSVAVMLLPTVAEAQSVNDEERIGRTTEITVGYSLYLGILCTGIFTTYGNQMGILFFNEASAGSYIAILGWLCPLLYLSTTIGSVINGMGHTGTTFVQNLIGLISRLAFVLILVPKFGIIGYLWGALFCQLLVSALHTLSLRKMISFSFSAFHRLIRPIAAISIAVWVTQNTLHLTGLTGLIAGCSVICIIYFLLLYITGTTRFPRAGKE